LRDQRDTLDGGGTRRREGFLSVDLLLFAIPFPF